MARSTLRDLADRLIPGGLDQWLLDRRRDDDSYAEIAYALRTEHDIAVSHETVRQWCQDAELEASA